MRLPRDQRLRATVLWMAAGLLLLVVAPPMLQAFTILALMAGFIIVGAYVIAGLSLWFLATRQFVRDRGLQSLKIVALVPGFLALVWLGGPIVLWASDSAFGFTRFVLLRPFYDRVVRDVQALPNPPRLGSYGLVDYEVDPGPPIRIVFPHFGGILDNWQGTIYDPSDAVAAATGWTTKHDFTAPPTIRSLFGGDLVACQRLRDHYYRCAFT